MATTKDDSTMKSGGGYEDDVTAPNFADRVKKIGKNMGVCTVNETIFKKWEAAYNQANDLELKSPDKTFLFSAQHKDCIILATVLTALNNSDTLIWRTDAVVDKEIDKVNNREYDKNAVNMSASLSLTDWEIWESANSFLINGSQSNVNTGACGKLLSTISQPGVHNIIRKLLSTISQPGVHDIIRKYYDKLEPRYLCVYEFNDEQLIRYVRLSKSWGTLVDDESKIKEKIQTIKQNFLTNDEYSQEIQSRILTTTPSSINPYISHILEPNNTIYSEMKMEIINSLKKLSKGGQKQSKRKQRKTQKLKKHRRSRRHQK
jgi:hypothetical protein